MIYIYDIIVNFNNRYYPFYDWLETDILEHIRKIPIVKITEKEMEDFINKEIVINKKHLDLLYNKTEIFEEEKIEKIRYASLFGSSNNVIAIIFDNEGNVKEISSLLLDEELEILEIIKSLKYYKFDYKVLCNREINNLLRDEEKIINKIIRELKVLKENKKDELLKYLYYEWFYKKANSNFYNILINNIKRKYTEKHLKFLELLELVKNT